MNGITIPGLQSNVHTVAQLNVGYTDGIEWQWHQVILHDVRDVRCPVQEMMFMHGHVLKFENLEVLELELWVNLF